MDLYFLPHRGQMGRVGLRNVLRIVFRIIDSSPAYTLSYDEWRDGRDKPALC